MISRQVRWSLQAGVVMVTLAVFFSPVRGGPHNEVRLHLDAGREEIGQWLSCYADRETA